MEEIKAEQLAPLQTAFLQIARFALSGQSSDALALIRRVARRASKQDHGFHLALTKLLSREAGPTLARGVDPTFPVDSDSRLELLRVENFELPFEPEWPATVEEDLHRVVTEREYIDELSQQNLYPTRSLLFTGPPGVGKTLAARWIARELERPLFVLDLSAVMSSFLGRTGNNLRVVLDFATRTECVLLLDEFDAIAKRRDDSSEIGELKRLVTVLLQAIDEWPSSGVLIAATNHAALLDPAVWRRFDQIMKFPYPDPNVLKTAISNFLGASYDERRANVLSTMLAGKSFSDARREVSNMRRRAVIDGGNFDQILDSYIEDMADSVSREQRIKYAIQLSKRTEMSQRRISDLTHVSRDTIRRQTKKEK